MKGRVAAVVAGCLVGTALAAANAMMGLKVGLWDTGSLTGALLAFALCRPLLKLLGADFTREHNNLAQAISSAIGTMPAAAGVMAALPALLLAGRPVSFSGLLVSS